MCAQRSWSTLARNLGWGEESSRVRPVSGCAVGRRSGSLGILEQSQIGDTAASGFLPKHSDCGAALNHKQDGASLNPWAVLESPESCTESCFMTCALGGECLLMGKAEIRVAKGVQGLSLPHEPQLPHSLQQ